MAKKVPSRSKVFLLATKYASQADIPALNALISQYRISRELLLRILLSYLPETLESKSYTSLLKNLASSQNEQSVVYAPIEDEICEGNDEKLGKKLHLLPLAWPCTPCDIATDIFSTFLIHRCLRIDESTGLTIEIPTLLDPFIEMYPHLKKWMVSTILPLLRLNYEYYPNNVKYISIRNFDELDARAAIAYLLSRTGKERQINSSPYVGRDLKGLVGPMLCAGTRKMRQNRLKSCQSQFTFVESILSVPSSNQLYMQWEEAFLWIFGQAEASWKTAVDAIEGWDGPDDYDLGCYDIESPFTEDEKLFLKRRYIRTAIATAYAISKESRDALMGIHRILVRILSLIDMHTIPSLESSCIDLKPVKQLDKDNLSQFSVINLKNLMNDENPMTKLTDFSINFLHASLVSSALCDRLECSINVNYAATLALQKDEYLQISFFNKLMLLLQNKSKSGDEFFIRVRNELLWLRSWGVKQHSNEKCIGSGLGILGQLSEEFIETEFLKVLLSNGCYNLAQTLYETSKNQLISRDTLCEVVLAAARGQYDRATNANISRGALKKCNDILKTFSITLSQSTQYQKMQKLLQLTCEIEPYRLVFKKGEPLKPAILCIHEDPILILGKILEQNPNSYKKIAEFIDMAKKMVQAGLIKNKEGHQVHQSEIYDEDLVVAKSRVIAMCIDAALFEDDFETAYFYVKTYLKATTGSALVEDVDSKTITRTQTASSTDKMNNWLWRAALQAGKYRGNGKATNLNITFDTRGRNQEISHLEKRMDCISLAIELAPKETLLEILNVYRRCEEELDSLLQQNIEEKMRSCDINDQKMPGGFVSTPSKQDSYSSSNPSKIEEPISLFDLSRAGMMRAQSGLSALSILKGIPKSNSLINSEKQPEMTYESDESGVETLTEQKRVRKRDQLKNVAVGGLATGVGWLIGAPLPRENLNDK